MHLIYFVAGLLLGRAAEVAGSDAATKAELTQTGATETAVTIKIEEEAAQAADYKIEYADKGGSNWVEYETILQAAATGSWNEGITNDQITLAAGTQYDFRLTITKTSGAGQPYVSDPVHTFATKPVVPTIEVSDADSTSIDFKWTNYDKYKDAHSAKLGDKDEIKPDSADFKYSDLTAATKYALTAKGTEFGQESDAFTLDVCTAPLAATVTEKKDGTTLTLTVKTGEGATSGLYFEFSADVATPPTSTTAGTFAQTTSGDNKSWKLPFTNEVTESTDVTATFTNFPDPAPTYEVKPYFDSTKGCAKEAIWKVSLANKETAFVYGVIGVMALILRALGLESYGFF